MPAQQLTAEAQAGYHAPAGATNPHLWSADTWLAWEAGRAMEASGRTLPQLAKKSRGHTVKIETGCGLVLLFKYDYKAGKGTLERLDQ